MRVKAALTSTMRIWRSHSTRASAEPSKIARYCASRLRSASSAALRAVMSRVQART